MDQAYKVLTYRVFLNSEHYFDDTHFKVEFAKKLRGKKE